MHVGDHAIVGGGWDVLCEDLQAEGPLARRRERQIGLEPIQHLLEEPWDAREDT